MRAVRRSLGHAQVSTQADDGTSGRLVRRSGRKRRASASSVTLEPVVKRARRLPSCTGSVHRPSVSAGSTPPCHFDCLPLASSGRTRTSSKLVFAALCGTRCHSFYAAHFRCTGMRNTARRSCWRARTSCDCASHHAGKVWLAMHFFAHAHTHQNNGVNCENLEVAIGLRG